MPPGGGGIAGDCPDHWNVPTGRGPSVLVVVISVFGVAVPIMRKVHLVAVLHRLVTTVLSPMAVLLDRMLGLNIFGHDFPFYRCRSVRRAPFLSVGDRIMDDAGNMFIEQ